MLMPALGITAAIVVLFAFVRLVEPRIAFFPATGESVTPRQLGVDYQPLSISTRGGERLHGWSLAGPAARANIVYFHGNGGNLSVWAPIVAGIARKGYAVLAFDYRGYGLSSGRPTERGLYEDVGAIVEHFWRDAPAGLPVVYWGRSLGVAMAAYAASVRKPDALILEAGFPDARSLLRGSPLLALLELFSSYRFPSAEFLGRLRPPVPVLVLHGDNDHVVPIAQGRALFDAIPTSTKQFVSIRGGDHNDALPSEPGTYWGAIEQLVAGLAPSTR
jgi:fermentation-respiration switch protein FrsA (DUF1100 family)